MAGPVDKAATAFRTISEVAEAVGVPQHVLRFWETRFPQIKPLKRGGNRRYYRPEDVELLRTINRLLHVEGYTIKGVQKLLDDGTPSPAAAAGSSSPAPIAFAPDVIAALPAIRARLAAALETARAL